MKKVVTGEAKKEQLVLVDGHSVLFRAFHAYPSLRTAKGEVVGAVYGFTNIVLTAIKTLGPEYMLVCFDREEPTFRHEEYKGYKAHRPEAPAELVDQQERVFQVVEALNIPLFAIPGYEADDLIGTLTRQLVALGRKGLEAIVVTSDRDLLQLVKDRQVMVWMPGRQKQPERLYDEMAVEQAYGLKPDRLVDLKALMGDQSDEIPGVKGIGGKTAVKLLQQYGSLERVYRAVNEIPDRLRKLLIKGEERARLSQKLARIVTEVSIQLDLEACRVRKYDKERAIKLFEELEFKSLIKKLPDDEFEAMVQKELF